MIHVHPLNDIKKHDLEGTQCDCYPEVIIESNSEIIVIHNSFDGREKEEWYREQLKKK
jgi:hypothetical protein